MILGILAALAYWRFCQKNTSKTDDKTAPTAALTRFHTDSLNKSINMILQQYIDLSDAFVETDTGSVKKAALAMLTGWSIINEQWFSEDTTLNRSMLIEVKSNVLGNLNSLIVQKDITEMRRDFSSLTEAIFPAFFTAVRYEGDKLYIQRCPMAFNDVEPASWISRSTKIMNPYLGKKHPVYQAGMLHCGEVVDSIQTNP